MSFKELGLCNEILSSIKDIGYLRPTEIQKQSIPHILMGRENRVLYHLTDILASN